MTVKLNAKAAPKPLYGKFDDVVDTLVDLQQNAKGATLVKGQHASTPARQHASTPARQHASTQEA